MKALILVLFVVLLTSQTDDRASLIAKENFAHAYKLPEEFTTQRLEGLIQDLVDKIHKVGFRYLGVEEDLFHGHVLFTMDRLTAEGRLYPFAIVYHTQEQAKRAHWGQGVDKKYDYLNVQTRNWLQWLDGDHFPSIENARNYLDERQKDRSLFFDVSSPIEGEAFTIHARNLDTRLLGYDVVGELQFEFYRFPCESEFARNLYVRGPIAVKVPGDGSVCMSLSTQSSFIDWKHWKN